MHRIDGPAAAPGGFFTDGDPSVGTPATVLTEDWANAVQEELVAVIEASGAVLAKPNNAQLLAAIRFFADAAFPPGFIAYDAGSVAPAGWSLADGGELDRIAHAPLFARIGTTYGVGNGSTTFNKPEIRGEIIRALDAGRGVDPGRVLGSWQDGQIQAHTHTLPSDSLDNSGNGYVADSIGGGIARTAVTGSTGGGETRMRNVALYALIKL